MAPCERACALSQGVRMNHNVDSKEPCKGTVCTATTSSQYLDLIVFLHHLTFGPFCIFLLLLQLVTDLSVNPATTRTN